MRKVIFILEESVFSNYVDKNSRYYRDNRSFIDFVAEKSTITGYPIATAPLSLFLKIKNSTYFKNKNVYTLIKGFIKEDNQVVTTDLIADCFELARIEAMNKNPMVITNGDPDELAKQGAHTTPVMTVSDILKIYQSLDF
jgi:hypothetical protein